MYVFILLSGVLAVSAYRPGPPGEYRPGPDGRFRPGQLMGRSYQADVNLPELQEKFRSALSELIDEVTNEAAPFFNGIGEEIEQCKAKLREEMSPCRECVQSECGEDVAGMLEDRIKESGLTEPASKRALISGAIGAFKVADWATKATTGNSISGHVSKATSSWWGRRKRSSPSEKGGMEGNQCLEGCDTCQRVLGPINKLVASVCGPDIFMEYGPVAEPIKALEQLQELNQETAILEKIEFTPDYAEVYAVFPSGTMMYESSVPVTGPDMATNFAQEYFMKYKKETELRSTVVGDDMERRIFPWMWGRRSVAKSSLERRIFPWMWGRRSIAKSSLERRIFPWMWGRRSVA